MDLHGFLNFGIFLFFFLSTVDVVVRENAKQILSSVLNTQVTAVVTVVMW